MEVSASIFTPHQKAAWKPQKPPNAISTQRKQPPSSGTALDSSVATRACDSPQNRRPTRSMSAAAPGPPSRTIASRPKGPEEMKMKMVPARVTTPRPLRSDGDDWTFRRGLSGVGDIERPGSRRRGEGSSPAAEFHLKKKEAPP